MSIVIAGATGNLGTRIVRQLRHTHDAEVVALVRKETPEEKLEALRSLGAKPVVVDLTSVSELACACGGASCVVSAVQGLRDVIVDFQSVLLEAAITAKVPRFIPSDFSTDFTQLPAGENRNFDLRREFHERLDRAPVAATAVFNGAFAEILTYNVPLLDLKAKHVGYWSDADWAIDFTSTDDTAAFTAAAAMDDDAPRQLRVASFQITPRELAEVASSTFGAAFPLVSLGSRDELRMYNAKERAAHPEGEREVYPRWQQSQYLLSMFSAHHAALDNARYPDVTCTTAREVVAPLARR